MSKNRTPEACALCRRSGKGVTEGWTHAVVGEGVACPDCMARIRKRVKPWQLPPERDDNREDDFHDRGSRANKLAIGRGELWKTLHEGGFVTRWYTERKGSWPQDL